MIPVAAQGAIVSFNFNSDPTLENGPPASVGAIYRFSNIGTGSLGEQLDALITLGTLHNAVYEGNGAYSAVDHTDNNDLAVLVRKTISGSSSTGWAEFRVDFVNAGTTTSAAPMDIRMNAYDIDGRNQGSNARFRDIFGTRNHSSAFLTSGTHLEPATLSNGNSQLPGYTAWRVDTQHQHELDVDSFPHQYQHTVTVDYLNTNYIELAYGAYGNMNPTISRIGSFDFSHNYTPPDIPEPSSLLLLATAGGVGATGSWWKKRKLRTRRDDNSGGDPVLE